MFFPPRYFVRVIKSMIFISCIFFIILLLMFTFAEKSKPDLQFWELISNWYQLVAFFVIFAITYPLIAFLRKEVWLIRPFSEEITQIITIFETLGYEQTDNVDGVLRFRPKNKFYRFMRLFFEDTIEIDYKNNSPIIITGLRKDTYRITRHIEYLNKKDE